MLTAGLLFYKQFILSFPLWLFLRKLEQILKSQQFEGRGIVLGIMQAAFFLHPLIAEKAVLLLLLNPHKCHLGSIYNVSFTEIFLSTFCRTSFSSVKKKNTKKKKKTESDLLPSTCFFLLNTCCKRKRGFQIQGFFPKINLNLGFFSLYTYCMVHTFMNHNRIFFTSGRWSSILLTSLKIYLLCLLGFRLCLIWISTICSVSFRGYFFILMSSFFSSEFWIKYNKFVFYFNDFIMHQSGLCFPHGIFLFDNCEFSFLQNCS